MYKLRRLEQQFADMVIAKLGLLQPWQCRRMYESCDEAMSSSSDITLPFDSSSILCFRWSCNENCL